MNDSLRNLLESNADVVELSHSIVFVNRALPICTCWEKPPEQCPRCAPIVAQFRAASPGSTAP